MQVPLSDWSAWAPGLLKLKDWELFVKGQLSLSEDSKPDVSFLPAMFRRKLSPLSRMIFCAVYNLKNKEAVKDAPLVFASRHGELDLSISLINSGIEAMTCSPAKFSMSVHNSPVGLMSIQHKNTRPSSAISSGKRTLEMGLIEAIGTAEEFGDCLLIYSDLPLSSEYEEYVDEKVFPVCVALHLKKKADTIELSFDNHYEFQALQLIKQLVKK